MIPNDIEKEFNNQVNEEIYSAYLYLAMAADLEAKNLPGFANWLKAQAQEEVAHAMKFYSHILLRGGRVSLEEIKKPQQTWETPAAAFEAAYKHEQHISQRISLLADVSAKSKDHASAALLQWFTNEQIEEEASTDAVVQKLKLAGEGGALFLLDKELAARAFAQPADPKGG